MTDIKLFVIKTYFSLLQHENLPVWFHEQNTPDKNNNCCQRISKLDRKGGHDLSAAKP